jgi:hypothetical protein
VQKMGVGGLGLREQARVDLRNRTARTHGRAVAEKDKEIAEMRSAWRIWKSDADEACGPAGAAAAGSAEKPKRKYTPKKQPR